ncbi:MAG: alpha/beta fold hydrolase, partial [Pseudomonadota bacterium]
MLILLRLLLPLVTVALLASQAPAVADDVPDRPVVVLPGIVGSVLEGPNDIYWGDAGALRRFERLMVSDGPRDPDDGLRATDLIDDIGVFGIPLVDQYNLLRDAFLEVGFEAGVSYFAYPYDWRQSNFTTASQLAAWIADHPVLANAEFDLVGHSMGGLIAEIYVRRHDPDRRVRRLVTMGTPLEGAVRAAGVLDDGWGDLANWFAGGLPAIKSVVLSFPSVYELLPRHTNCCAVGVPGDAEPLDITTMSGWEKIDWRSSTAPDLVQVEQALAAGRELGVLVASRMPEHLEVYRIISTLFDTPRTIYVDPNTRAVSTIVPGPGDGVVAAFSATRSRSDVADVTAAKHQTIFDDDGFVGALEVIFTDVIGPPKDVQDTVLSGITKDDVVVAIDTVGIYPEKSIAAIATAIEIRVRFSAEGRAPLDRLSVSLIHPDGSWTKAGFVQGSYRFDPAGGRVGRAEAEFLGTLPGLKNEGALRFSVAVGTERVASDAIQIID